MCLKKMNRFLSRIPVSIRVTVWFSSVIVILFLIILSSLILIEDKVVNDLSQKELVEAVEEIYEDLFEQVKRKKKFSTNDLLVIDYYFSISMEENSLTKNFLKGL